MYCSCIWSCHHRSAVFGSRTLSLCVFLHVFLCVGVFFCVKLFFVWVFAVLSCIYVVRVCWCVCLFVCVCFSACVVPACWCVARSLACAQHSTFPRCITDEPNGGPQARRGKATHQAHTA